MLTSASRDPIPLKALTQRLNRCIQEGPFREIPVCALLGSWDPSRGRLHLLNAGIPHGLCSKARDKRTRTLALNGTPLGIFDEPLVEERVLWLEPGDRLLFATDGCFEATTPQGPVFADRAPSLWSELRPHPIHEALAAFVERARHEAGGTFQDDVLVMTFEQPEVQRKADFSLWIPSKASALDKACQRLKDFLANSVIGSAITPARRFDLILATRELLTNALYHGHASHPDGEIHLRCNVDEQHRSLELLVCDEGTGFDLAAHPGPSDPLSERGRGLPFIRAIGGSLAVEAGEVRMFIPWED